jgi:hypothetical protein
LRPSAQSLFWVQDGWHRSHLPFGQPALLVQTVPALELSAEHFAKNSLQVSRLSTKGQHSGVSPGVQTPPEQLPVPGTAQSSSTVQSAPMLPVKQVNETRLQVPGVWQYE